MYYVYAYTLPDVYGHFDVALMDKTTDLEEARLLKSQHDTAYSDDGVLCIILQGGRRPPATTTYEHLIERMSK